MIPWQASLEYVMIDTMTNASPTPASWPCQQSRGVSRILLTLVLAVIALQPHRATADEPERFFETRIRPLFAEHCYECHGPRKQRGGLRLDARAAFVRGGDGGPVVVAGDPERSTLIRAVRHVDPDLKMPPKKKLSERQIADLTAWVRMGASYPEDRKPVAASENESVGPRLRGRNFVITPEDRAWWAFQPVRRVAAMPPGAEGAANTIDTLLLARLRERNLGFSAPASRRELVRRAWFDLIGLPPPPEAVKAFERDISPDAWERLVDDLLSRPQYGERWARHWLDVVRYAETNGYERDGTKPHAWRYRDYVIKSFNEDKPYDRFILEQLAGDELQEGFNPDALVATGFYRLHVWDDEPDSTLAAEFDDLDDMVVTTSAAFLGLTVGCARCHDHKFDPISQADYYQMLAFFRSINPYGLHKTGGGGRGTGRITRPLAPPSAVRAWREGLELQLRPLRERLAFEQSGDIKGRLQAEITRIESEAPFGYALAVVEDPVKPTHLFHRGDVLAPRNEVQPAFLSVLAGEQPQISPPAAGTSSGRRLALARWIARPDNPLTARVLVNRLWQHHFGRGLVPTPNDFGRTGMKPSHPELLDYLSAELVTGGWRVKRLHKLIMMSQAYRMASRVQNPAAVATDEGNELLWRQNPRRAEAEVLRDSLLAVSGALDDRMGGPSFFPALAKEVLRTQDSDRKGWLESPPQEQNRRSIYAFVKRGLLVPLLESFDYTTTTLPVGARSVTTVAPQALMLLNDPFVQQQGERFAQRLRREAGPDTAAQIRRAFALAVQRSPTNPEVLAALQMIQAQERLARAAGDALAEETALRGFCIALFNLNEMLYTD